MGLSVYCLFSDWQPAARNAYLPGSGLHLFDYYIHITLHGARRPLFSISISFLFNQIFPVKSSFFKYENDEKQGK